MRKFYSFLALAIMFVAGAVSASAQDYYDVIDFDLGPDGAVTDIEPGKWYVLQVASSAEAGFFNGSGAKVSTASPTSLFCFEEAGEQDGFMTYYLKQKSSGNYLASGVSFVESKARAFRFFAKHPTTDYLRGVDTVPLDVDPTTMSTYDDEHYGGNPVDHDRAYIFTDVEAATSDGWTPSSGEAQLGGREDDAPWSFFCGHWNGAGYAPFFGPWSDTNSWYLYEVEEQNAYDQLESYIMQEFPNGATLDGRFVEGTAMGQVPSQYYQACLTALETAYELVNEGGGRSSQEYLEAYNALKDAIQACVDNAIGFRAGYYMLADKRSNKWAREDNNNKVQCTKDFSPAGVRPEELGTDHMPYIFQFVADRSGSNSFKVKGYYHENYVVNTNSNSVVLSTSANESEAEVFTVEVHPSDANYFAVRSTTRNAVGWNTDTAGTGVVFYSYTDAGSLWKLYEVTPEEIAALDAIKQQAIDEDNQRKLNSDLATLIADANSRYRSAQAFTSEADQDAYFDQTGLVDGGKVWTNAPLTEEDGIQPAEIDNLFDGDYSTQFHTAWQWATGERFDWHNLAVELPEPLSAVTLKYAKRTGSNQLGAPILCHFYTTNDTTGYTNDDYSGWVDQGYITFTYPYNLPEELGIEGTQENMVGIASIQFDNGQAWKYFRFDVEDNQGSNRNANTGNLYFNMGEFRVFKATYDPENSLLNQIPAELTQALLNEIAAARNQLAAGDATQEQYDKLKEALDNFNAEYPDVAALREYIEEMKTLVEGAEEGSGIGYFAAGAQAEAQNAINTAEAKVTDKMTAAQIKEVRAEIESAIATLNSKLVKPAGGAYYRIFSTSTGSGSQNGNYIYAAGSGETALRWNGSAADANLTDKLNSIWRAIDHGNGTYSFQNAFTGDYLNAADKVSNDVKNGVASALKLQFAGAAGSFEIVSGEDVCINCDPSGKVVTYYTGDANAKFGFEPEANNSWSGDQVIEPTDDIIVVTLPFAVQYTEPDVYTVVGKNLEAQTLELEFVSDEIPAGTPFVVKNPSANVVYATPVATDFPQLVYAPAPLTVDGLVGVYAAKEIGPNYGVFYRGQLVKSYSGDVVGANTGYVDLANVPTVTTTGDLSVPIEEALIDVLTGVETITVAGNTVQNGIFDLQGRRVVKAQKGLYIINGKKVLVK